MMYNYDKDYDLEEEGGWLKSAIWIAAVGLAGYALYKLISEPDLVREMGDKVRSAGRKVKEKAEDAVESVQQEAGNVHPEWADTTT